MSALAVATRPNEGTIEDRALVAAVRAGDDRAFECLYGRYHRRIFAYVRGMVHDHGRAEDITQDVFMSALRRMRETDRDIAFKPWVYEIAKNACIDAFRRSRRAEEISFDANDGLPAGEMGRLADAPVTPDAAMDTKQQLDDLRGAFGGLSEAHHEILVMREFEGLSYREIGERLGMTRPSVESTLFRARRRLSEEYEELVSGERCVRVQAIIAIAGGRTVGARDQRRLARHISHCQPCRRHARLAGVDLTALEARPAAARIAAFLPLPAFLRRRWFGGSDDGGVLVSHASASTNVAQWSANVVGTLDPATVAGWSKAVAAAATVAVAGVGAGAAISEREAIRNLVSKTPIVSKLDPRNDATKTERGANDPRLPGSAAGGVTGVPALPGGGAEDPAGAGRTGSGERRGGVGGAVDGAREPGSGSTQGGSLDRGGAPGAPASPPIRRPPPTFGDLTGPLGLGGTTSTPAGDGNSTDSSGAPADESTGTSSAPIRDVLEKTLGGSGSVSAGAGADTGAAAGEGDVSTSAPGGADPAGTLSEKEPQPGIALPLGGLTGKADGALPFQLGDAAGALTSSLTGD